MVKIIMMLFRTGVRLILLICIGLIITVGLVVAFYKPIYEVTIKGYIVRTEGNLLPEYAENLQTNCENLIYSPKIMM